MVGESLRWFLPQCDWVAVENRVLLVDELLRYETLEEDWNEFSARFGLNAELAHRNVSREERDYRSYYSSRWYDVVCEYYKDDLDAFGYSFD